MIYIDFTTVVDNDENFGIDGTFVTGTRSDKLLIRFEHSMLRCPGGGANNEISRTIIPSSAESPRTSTTSTPSFAGQPQTSLTGASDPGQARAREKPNRQPRGPPLDDLGKKPTSKHEGNKNFNSSQTPRAARTRPQEGCNEYKMAKLRENWRKDSADEQIENGGTGLVL